SAQTVNYSNLTIQLSTTSKAAGSLSTTYASNVGPDVKTVFATTPTSPYSFTTAFTGPAGGPKSFDEVVTLTTPFLYDPAARNIISGNNGAGVTITDSGTAGNSIAGNYIGLAPDGLQALANHYDGVNILNGAAGNFIGTNSDGINDATEGNVIAASQNNNI